MRVWLQASTAGGEQGQADSGHSAQLWGALLVHCLVQ